MEFSLELITGNSKVEIGRFSDLEVLVQLLNLTCEGVEYRLDKIEGYKNLYLFVEDVKSEDDYSCGIVERQGRKAIAASEAVYNMIMGAYARHIQK